MCLASSVRTCSPNACQAVPVLMHHACSLPMLPQHACGPAGPRQQRHYVFCGSFRSSSVIQAGQLSQQMCSNAQLLLTACRNKW